MYTVLRKMKEEDLPDVMKIEKELFSLPWPQDAFLHEFKRHEAYVLICEDKIIGYICGWKVLNEISITNVGISKEYQRHGLGGKMVEEFIVMYRDECDMFFLEVRESNLPARKLYEKLGFQEVGIRKKYYSQPVEDAVMMVLSFTENITES